MPRNGRYTLVPHDLLCHNSKTNNIIFKILNLSKINQYILVN